MLSGRSAQQYLVPTIVIVDDNEPLRRALKREIAAHDDWTVCGEADNGLEAVRLARKLKPDAVLLDFKMPVMNGLEAAREIIRNDPSIPIAMYTLDQNSQIETEARKAGVRRVISKIEIFSCLTKALDEMVVH